VGDVVAREAAGVLSLAAGELDGPVGSATLDESVLVGPAVEADPGADDAPAVGPGDPPPVGYVAAVPDDVLVDALDAVSDEVAELADWLTLDGVVLMSSATMARICCS
jgi:hypothetical protein